MYINFVLNSTCRTRTQKSLRLNHPSSDQIHANIFQDVHSSHFVFVSSFHLFVFIRRILYKLTYLCVFDTIPICSIIKSIQLVFRNDFNVICCFSSMFRYRYFVVVYRTYSLLMLRNYFPIFV